MYLRVATARKRPAITAGKTICRRRTAGFTLAELLVVIVIFSMLLSVAAINLVGMFGKTSFEAQAQELVSALDMAARAAAESERRYEVIIDPIEQSYILREITTPDLSEVLGEEIIIENYMNHDCRIGYIEFDDGEYTNQERAKFRAGHAGWAYGGKIVLYDDEENPYSIVINRINTVVQLKSGDVQLPQPVSPDEIRF